MLRLMNVKTHQLDTFNNWAQVPPYSILSHTWEEGEVIFHDISADVDKKKQGWSKILGACNESEKIGIFYLWVDTCCIFKESSAELSESINSMFAWYRDARICFAYIGDFGGNDNEALFGKSRWWTRGWTLQELIAPTEVMFFTKDWSFIGLRTSLASRITKITGISEEILSGGNLHMLHNFSVAEKFSWAAKRKTTCGEDRAYSLLGIFGVNMPMIYGEGEQAAFFRLQKEIFGVFADHSMFAWHRPSWTPEKTEIYDLFAPSISAFEDSSNIISDPYDWDIIGRPKESTTKIVSNKQLAKYSAFSHGLCIQLLVQNIGEGYFLAHLACRDREKIRTCLGLNLLFDKRTGHYHRTSLDKLREVEIDGYFSYKVTLADVYVAQQRLDFALSLRPVRYQLESSSNIEAMLYLIEDAVYKSGFSRVAYLPQVTHLEQSRSLLPSIFSTPHSHLTQVARPPRTHRGCQKIPRVSHFLQKPRRIFQRRRNSCDDGDDQRALPGPQLWHHDQDSALIYKNQKTGESFAVLIATSQKRLSQPQGFLVGILEDINPDTFGAEAVEEFFKHNSHLLTDLSTQMLVKFLRSGKQVILSVHTLTVGSLQNFKLWVVLKEPKI